MPQCIQHMCMYVYIYPPSIPHTFPSCCTDLPMRFTSISIEQVSPDATTLSHAGAAFLPVENKPRCSSFIDAEVTIDAPLFCYYKYRPCAQAPAGPIQRAAARGKGEEDDYTIAVVAVSVVSR